MAEPFFFTWSAQQQARGVSITGGEGCYFDTSDGERWLDLGSLTYHVNAGHGRSEIVEAIKRQADALCVAMPSSLYPAKRELAERLLELAPEGFDRVFFTLGGAEANENALKIARMVTGRYKLLSRYRSYHGATMGAITLSGDPRRPPVEPGLVGVVHAMDCYCDRCPFGKTLATCRRECASHIDDVLGLEQGVAAVFLEPVVGANGVLVPPDDYWPLVRQACDRHGALLVADEVLTGFGRTGRWFGFQHYQGVVPDMITVAKGLTAGYGTLGAVLVHQRVSSFFDDKPLYAGLTSYAHPLGCAAALAAIETYQREDLIDNAAELEEPLLAGLRQIAARHPGRCLFVRGKGLLAAIEMDASDAQLAALKAAFAQRRVHIFVKPNRCLILAPPLCIDRELLAHALDLVGEVLDEVFGQQSPETP